MAMNNGWLLIGLMLAGLFLFRRPPTDSGVLGVYDTDLDQEWAAWGEGI